MPLELTYTVEPDEHGVIDGRDLARQMIGNAYRLLVPYVSACPACADNLFTAIANQALDAMHEDARAKGKLAGFFYSVRPPGPERDEGEKAHLAAARDKTVALLLKATGAEPHQHEDEP